MSILPHVIHSYAQHPAVKASRICNRFPATSHAHSRDNVDFCLVYIWRVMISSLSVQDTQIRPFYFGRTVTATIKAADRRYASMTECLGTSICPHKRITVDVRIVAAVSAHTHVTWIQRRRRWRRMSVFL
jgi:hypothetical protein